MAAYVAEPNFREQIASFNLAFVSLVKSISYTKWSLKQLY